jgi:hypothetical protein
VVGRDCLSFAGDWVHRRFLAGSALFIFLALCIVLFVLFVFALCLVYPMLPVSLNYLLVIAPSFSLTFIET